MRSRKSSSHHAAARSYPLKVRPGHFCTIVPAAGCVTGAGGLTLCSRTRGWCRDEEQTERKPGEREVGSAILFLLCAGFPPVPRSEFLDGTGSVEAPHKHTFGL